MSSSSSHEFETLRLWLRDGVDVYISPNSDVHFVFLATRKRIRLKVCTSLIDSLEWFSGSSCVAELNKKYQEIRPTKADGSASSFLDFAHYLYEKGILVEKDWMAKYLPAEKISRFSRQLNFFLDVEGSAASAVRIFQKIQSTRIALVGVGAVGSWILKELLQIGFQKFVLIDPKVLSSTDVSRNAFFSSELVGMAKVDVAERYVRSEAIDPEVRVEKRPLNIDTEVNTLIGSDVDLIINTADEPYIGATSIKLSRYCVKKTLPLLVAGGFDAHLASLSELIVPGQTPCADCYAVYFENALQGWKPIQHPITNRNKGFGGLPSLSAFAASAAVLKIVRFLSTNGSDVENGRGEFLFDSYQIDSFEVERNPDCPACSQAERHSTRVI